MNAAQAARPRRRLFWYVYLHGLLMLLVMLVAVIALGRIISVVLPFSTWAEDFARNISQRSNVFEDPEDLKSQLERERRRSGVEMTVRDLGGKVIATNVEPPLQSLPEGLLPRIHRGPVPMPVFGGSHRPLRYLLSIALPDRKDPEGYITIAVPLGLPIAERLSVMFIGALGVLALVSIPLARLIARPMERLTTTARALGKGDLAVRSGIRRNDEVGELAFAFDEMAERLQRLMRGEKDLLANVSHELRTPLSRIGVALDLASEGDAAAQRRYLQEIRSDVVELEKLVNDVLTAAKLNVGVGESGLLPLKKQRVAAAELLERSARQFRESHPERELEVELSGALPQLDVDPELVRRALDNVLENARKYSDAGQPIGLWAAARDGALTIEVRDRGIGIEPEDIPRLFTPFFRTDKSRARGTGGVGLGLALTKRIVEAHGGSVSVESVPGERTTVRFALPSSAP